LIDENDADTSREHSGTSIEKQRLAIAQTRMAVSFDEFFHQDEKPSIRLPFGGQLSSQKTPLGTLSPEYG